MDKDFDLKINQYDRNTSRKRMMKTGTKSLSRFGSWGLSNSKFSFWVWINKDFVQSSENLQQLMPETDSRGWNQSTYRISVKLEHAYFLTKFLRKTEFLEFKSYQAILP